MTALPVTVLMPTRNIVRYLPRALASVAAQGDAWRLVAVDSASTDGTREVLERFRQEHGGRVQVLDDAKARLSEAVNLAVVAAEPGWLQWLGGDDAVVPGAHAALRRAAADHPEAEWFLGDTEFRDADGGLLSIGKATPWDRLQMLESNRIYTAAAFYTRDLAVRSGLCSPVLRRSMDYDWWFRMAWLTTPVVLGATTAAFTLRNESLSGGLHALETARECLHVRQFHADFSPREQAILARVVVRRYLPLAARQKLRPAWLVLKAQLARARLSTRT